MGNMSGEELAQQDRTEEPGGRGASLPNGIRGGLSRWHLDTLRLHVSQRLGDLLLHLQIGLPSEPRLGELLADLLVLHKGRGVDLRRRKRKCRVVNSGAGGVRRGGKQSE